MAGFAESHVEEACLEWLASLGYGVLHGPDIAPDGASPERHNYGQVILRERLRAAATRLNPNLPPDSVTEALRKLEQTETPSLVEENRRLHGYLVDGIPIEVTRPDGSIGGDVVRLVDHADPAANDWQAVNQFTVIEHGHNRRPDIVLFLNGLPVAVIELKNPSDENATLAGAYNQLQTYKAEISALFRTNEILVTSDGLQARAGSLTANPERFMPWRTTDGRAIAPKGTPELDTLVMGVFQPRRFLDLIRDFVVFGNTDDGLVKIVAGYHQFHAVGRAVRSTLRALAQNQDENREAADSVTGLGEDPAQYDLPGVDSHPRGDKRVGVIWHTQGSGKSLLMAFYAGQLVRRPEMRNPTIIVVTDRNDLDDQLFGTFAMCQDLVRQPPMQADSRAELREMLARPSGGVIFTTIQKFSPDEGETDYPALTARGNVVVIADEAHRSQYGFRAKVARKSGEISYGFAKYLRDALPNASFIGFTGTPIEKDDVNTPAVFGHYIDIYDINRGVEDGATVPIYYESRLARVEIDEDERPKVDEEVAAILEDDTSGDPEKLKRRANVEAVIGAEKRLKLVAQDLVDHFENRVAALDGKAMVVCVSRSVCVRLYDEIVALRPEWHNDVDDKGVVKVVMTGAAADPQDWQQHIGGKARRDLLAKRAKNAADPLKLVLVRDMWLTGFDAPSMHTMYVDKPMRGHGLMQAIARVNRVFRDKPAGLVVDYIGIAQNLKSALGQYSGSDRQHTGIDEAEAVAVMLEKYEVVRDIYHGFDYLSGVSGTPSERLKCLAAAMEWVLAYQQREAEKQSTEDGKKQAHRRYADAVLELSKAFALAAASDEAKAVRDEVGFFQTVRAALAKSTATGGKSPAEKNLAIQQIVSRAVVSTEIVDILQAAGLETPDISILSEEFLAEVQGMEKKNLAMEALRKLLNGEIRSRTQTNVVQTKAFSERLEEAIARYHANALTTAEVIQELINLARDIREAHRRGDETGLSSEEIAFYDALAQNESAVDVMGDEQLRVIAQELLNNLRSNASVDWQHRSAARARMRVLVKRILRKYGYPPDLQDDAVKTVLQQAEVLAERWAA